LNFQVGQLYGSLGLQSTKDVQKYIYLKEKEIPGYLVGKGSFQA